jgi:hypothetical protein
MKRALSIILATIGFALAGFFVLGKIGMFLLGAIGFLFFIGQPQKQEEGEAEKELRKIYDDWKEEKKQGGN